MASFLDSFLKITLVSTQIYAIYALGELLQKMKLDSVTNEIDFTKKYGEQTEWMIETGQPSEWISNRLEKFVPEFRRAQRSKKFWNGLGGNLLFIIFILLQILASVAFFQVNFVPGLR